MNNNEISLKWKPITVADVQRKGGKQVLDRGVYLWCLERTTKSNLQYIIAYVGKANIIGDRLRDQIAGIQEHNSLLFNLPETPISEDNENEALYIKYVPGHDSRTECAPPDLVQRNLDRYRFFYASLEAYPDVEPEDVEGAIQLHLFRNPITRKYLITAVSSYRLRSRLLINDTGGATILGLEGSISTPS